MGSTVVGNQQQIAADSTIAQVSPLRLKRHQLLFRAFLVFLVSTTLYTTLLYDAPIFTRGEAREALVVEAMIANDDLVLPYTNAHQISAKPPLFHWIAVGLSELTGEADEATIRMVSAVTIGLSLALFFLFVATNTSASTAWLTVFLLATAAEWFRAGSHARVDGCLALGLTWALCSFYMALRLSTEKNRVSPFWLLSAACGIALAILAKGPMGGAIPAAVVGIYWLVQSGRPYFHGLRTFPYLSHALPFVLGASAAGIWYFLAYQHRPDEFFRVHVVNENLARFIEVPNYEPGHRKPIYYGPIYLFTGFLPWSLFLPLLILWFRNGKPRNESIQFCIVWAAVIVAMGCIASAKRSVYFLPAFPPIAFLFATAIEDALRDPERYRRMVGAVRKSLFGLLGILVVTYVVLIFASYSDSLSQHVLESGVVRPKDRAKTLLIFDMLQSVHFPLVVFPFLLAGMFIAIRHFREQNLPKSVFTIATLVILGGITVGRSYVHYYASATEPSAFVRQLDSVLPAEADVYQFKDTYFATSYYGNRMIPLLDDVPSAPESPLFFLVEEKREEEFLKLAPGAKLVIEGNEFTANTKGKLKLYRAQSEPPEQAPTAEALSMPLPSH